MNTKYECKSPVFMIQRSNIKVTAATCLCDLSSLLPSASFLPSVLFNVHVCVRTVGQFTPPRPAPSRSYHPGRSPASRRRTSRWPDPFRWLSWLLPGSCTGCPSPDLHRGCVNQTSLTVNTSEKYMLFGLREEITAQQKKARGAPPPRPKF